MLIPLPFRRPRQGNVMPGAHPRATSHPASAPFPEIGEKWEIRNGDVICWLPKLPPAVSGPGGRTHLMADPAHADPPICGVGILVRRVQVPSIGTHCRERINLGRRMPSTTRVIT